MAKMGNSMVALCAAAIGIIYTAGYAVTDHAEHAVAQNVQAVANASKNTQDASSETPSVKKMKYRDGTYTGQGTNRFGTVEVAVVINQGKITSVQITNSSTHYPQSYIDPQLPQEVIAQQSGNVDVVSGATRSSEDFQMAVQQALQQAQS